jgi:hypothetical protein
MVNIGLTGPGDVGNAPDRQARNQPYAHTMDSSSDRWPAPASRLASDRETAGTSPCS